MAKKKPAGEPVTTQRSKRELNKLDKEIIRLILDRIQEFDSVPVTQTAFDEELARSFQVIEKNAPAAEGELIQNLFREINSVCFNHTKQQRVAYLGPQFSFSHDAAVTQFGSSSRLVPLNTIAAVFDELENRQVDYGVVPLENSTNGSISDTLTMFVKTKVRISGEIPLRVHHCLLANCDHSKVKEIISKPQAIAQCRGWISKHLPNATIRETTSTTYAAEQAKVTEGVAAIASAQAAKGIGIPILAKNIEDNKKNVTRFAVISHFEPAKTNNDKTALLFEVAHQPGSLADVMSIFKRAKLNLTWIESFPIVGSHKEYLFFAEFVGHKTEAKVKRALVSLEKKTSRLEILGSFPKSDS